MSEKKTDIEDSIVYQVTSDSLPYVIFVRVGTGAKARSKAKAIYKRKFKLKSVKGIELTRAICSAGGGGCWEFATSIFTGSLDAHSLSAMPDEPSFFAKVQRDEAPLDAAVPLCDRHTARALAPLARRIFALEERLDRVDKEYGEELERLDRYKKDDEEWK